MIEFRFGDCDLVSPTDFVGFFGLGEQIVRELVLTEAVDALEAAEIGGRDQLETTDLLQKLLLSGPVPAEVADVRHSSPWMYILHLPAAMVATFVSRCLIPEIKRAWKGSRREQEFYEFFRSKVFGGAKAKVQKSVVHARRRPRKGIIPVDVQALPQSTERSQRLLVQTERTRTLEVVVSNEELLREMQDRLKGK